MAASVVVVVEVVVVGLTLKIFLATGRTRLLMMESLSIPRTSSRDSSEVSLLTDSTVVVAELSVVVVEIGRLRLLAVDGVETES